jgi:hypothetical protein
LKLGVRLFLLDVCHVNVWRVPVHLKLATFSIIEVELFDAALHQVSHIGI